MSGEQVSILGAQIQLLGTGLVALLLWLQLRTLQRVFLYHWASAWCCLTLALGIIVVTLQFGGGHLGLMGYCLAEYAFGFLLITGCRHLTRGVPIGQRDLLFVVPLLVLGLVLPWAAGGDVSRLMVLHMPVMAVLCLGAFAELWRGRRGPARGAGLLAMLVFSLALAVDFLQYAPFVGLYLAKGRNELFPHVNYNSFIDMTIEVLLAYGMTMVVTDIVRADLEAVNRELRAAGRHFRALSEADPLTGALNRRAFETILNEPKSDGPGHFTGCAVMFDMDNLKPVNDALGHAAGDRAIRLVAESIRGLIRPADLLFRWGGDEFVLLWFNLKEADAAARLAKLPQLLVDAATRDGLKPPTPLTVSSGVAPFNGRLSVPAAVEEADRRMYGCKQTRSGRRRVEVATA